jgi:hypothetical protein
MKKTLLIIALLYSFISLRAQHYYPMLDSANIWIYTGNIIPATTPPGHQVAATGVCYYFSGTPIGATIEVYTTSDTTDGGHTYKIVLQNPASPCYMGLIREDTAAHQVFFKDNLGDPEGILYDFSKTIGDSLLIHARPGNYFQTGTYRVDSIGYIHIKAGKRRIFYLNCHACGAGYNPLEWVEGSGNRADAIYSYSPISSGGGGLYFCPGYPHTMSSFMACFEHKYIEYYDTCSFYNAQHNSCIHYQDTCDYYDICGGIKEYSSFSKWVVFPNPAGNRVTLQLDVNVASLFEIRVLDVNGREVMKPQSLGELGTGLNERELDLTSLCNGFYFIECRSGQDIQYQKLSVQK